MGLFDKQTAKFFGVKFLNNFNVTQKNYTKKSSIIKNKRVTNLLLND